MRYRWLLVLGATPVAAAILMAARPAVAMPLAPASPRVATVGEPLGFTSAPDDGRCAIHVRSAADRLPVLDGTLTGALARYGRVLPAGASDAAWRDSGSPFGGGVPVGSVRILLRTGMANGLSEEQVAAFLSPGFLRGIADPNGGGDLLGFVLWRADPTFFQELAYYARSVRSSVMSPMEAQASLFRDQPLLLIAYEALAGVPPLDEGGAAIMAEIAEAGYRPAQRTIDRILAAGNHPRAGAPDSGSVADGVRPDVYDFFVSSYRGPLSPDARIAVANRLEYLAWVDRIASWVAEGSSVDRIPATADFVSPAQPSPATAAAVSRVEEACST
jgi:hypothetical protein